MRLVRKISEKKYSGKTVSKPIFFYYRLKIYHKFQISNLIKNQKKKFLQKKIAALRKLTSNLSFYLFIFLAMSPVRYSSIIRINDSF